MLLLPFQVSVLGTPNPSVTPTNLLYNVVAGSVIRVKLIPSPRVFALVVAAVLIPLGTWLVLTRPARACSASNGGTELRGCGRVRCRATMTRL